MMMKPKEMINKVKNKVIDKTSTAIANVAFGGNKANKQIKSANAYANNLKFVRERKGMPDSGMESVNGKPDELFRARVSTPILKDNYESAYAKKMNPKFPTR